MATRGYVSAGPPRLIGKSQMLFFRLEKERLHIVGQVDATTIDAFEARITQAIGSGPVILDMTGVDFIDSTGLGVLLTMSRRPGAPRPLCIVPSEPVRRIFDVTGLDALPAVEFLPHSLESR